MKSAVHESERSSYFCTIIFCVGVPACTGHQISRIKATFDLLSTVNQDFDHMFPSNLQFVFLIYVYYGSWVCFLASFNQTSKLSHRKLWGNLWKSTTGLHIIFLER